MCKLDVDKVDATDNFLLFLAINKDLRNAIRSLLLLIRLAIDNSKKCYDQSVSQVTATDECSAWDFYFFTFACASSYQGLRPSTLFFLTRCSA